MKYVKISPTDTLVDLTNRVGSQNVDQILADNGLTRNPKIGRQWSNQVKEILASADIVSNERKVNILNQLVDNSDVYEHAALADDNDWKILSAKNTFSNYLYISEQLEDSIPTSFEVLGNKEPVAASIYEAVRGALLAYPENDIDQSLFTNFSAIRDVVLAENSQSNVVRTTNNVANNNPMSWFNLPTNTITLYSSLSGESINIPTYPEEVSDTRIANYTQMPELIYQYEPWQMYQSSGPRSNTYEFHLHRDMWTGNHNDGNANNLIRFCQAQLYPQYNGASVNSATVTLYINGSVLISGVMTNVDVNWKGPIGHDGWYLEFTLALTITEVATQTLDYATVANLGVIG